MYSEQLHKQLLETFKVQCEPVRRSFLYRLGLVLVAFVMVILPVVYLAIVIAAAGGVVWYATHYGSIKPSGVTSARIHFLAYVGPLVIGSVIVTFMAMPLIPKFRRKREPFYVITAKNEPGFYAFIELVCRSVNAPMPKQIELTMEPNAAAFLRRGFLSFFFPRDLGLVVGLPLLCSLNVQQLAGVIAHEMGHFTQGGGMRFSYLIESVHRWFYHAVYEGRSVDKHLATFMENARGAIALIAVLSQLFVMLTRLVLLGFMMLGYLVSNFLSRQMEYDADLCMMRVAGAKAVETTMYTLSILGIAWEDAYYMSMATWSRHILCDNLPLLVRARAKEYAAKAKDEVINSILTANTHLFDTHPCARDRIARAKRANVTGICQLKTPSADLFGNFRGLSRRLTSSFYLDAFDMRIPEKSLLDKDKYIEFFENHRAEFAAGS